MVLFKGRIFRLALLISIAWHLVWMYGIRVELFSHQIKQIEYPTISFLGPILEETIFKKEPKINLPSSISPLQARGLVKDNLNLQSWLLKRSIVRRIVQIRDRDKGIPQRVSDGLNKRMPPSTYQSAFRPKTVKSKPFPEIGQVKGPVEERRVFYQPSLPVLPDWLRQERLRLNIEIKFWLSKEGLVEYAEPLISCGYPEIDLLMVTYLNKWRFQPLAAEELDNQQDQWGIVRLSFYDQD